ncbi:MAG: hypothetical protein VX871_07870 [Pseudomonadota bacterium]|nr:hypothetical protein [Pseudomonadota bacterium]
MEAEIVALVLASAMLHPVWNLILKKEPDPELGYLGLTVTLALIGLAQSLASGNDFSAILSVLPLVALSWAGQVLYGTCLTATLSRGDLSAYYPIIRASPLFVVAAGVLVMGRHYPWPVLLGIAMAVAGGFLLLYRRGTSFLDDPATLGLALAAMSGTGIYSIADAQMMQTLTPQMQMFVVEGLLVPFYLSRYLIRARRRDIVDDRHIARRLAFLFLPGLLAYVSYYLILLAYQWGGEVAAVTAIRQASIPVSVLLGGYFLREGAMLRRFGAAGLLALGIVVIALYG